MRIEDLSDGAVWLRAPTAADIDAIDRCCRHPSIGQWTTAPVPYTRADAQFFVEQVVPAGWAHSSPTWGIRAAANGDVLGMIGLVAREPGVADVGFWLAADARSRGIMAAAVKLVCRFGFRTKGIGLERIEWRAYVGNHASAAVARRAGFRYEGLLRNGVLQRGTRRDAWLAALLHTDPIAHVDDWPEGI